MQKQLKIWQQVKKSLQENIPVVLLYVVESKGSSPGRQGFAMMINANGVMEGSIGGGIMEHKLVELAKDKILNRDHTFFLRKQVHNKVVAEHQSGMICSGEQTVLIYPIATHEHEVVNAINECYEQDNNGYLQLSPQGLAFSKENPGWQAQFTYHSENNWHYAEPIGYAKRVHIIGGGHCSLALSRILSMLNFCIHLYDDRPDLNTFEDNIFVKQKTILDDYAQLQTLIEEDAEGYVVIMTFGYRTDDIAFRALLGKRFRYVGLLGSKKKIEKLFQQYLDEGISKEELSKIHAPVGVPIHSQTPEEIAVSIAAEIIKVKNGGR